jgi:hypothetical protein
MKNEGKILQGIRPKTIDLEFLVVYKDGTTLEQRYNVGKEFGEKHFGDIELDKVKEFHLVDRNGNKHYTVNVERQSIFIKGLEFKVQFPRDKEGKEVKGKLVYYRRIRNDFNPEGIKTNVTYLIGFQALIDGVNKQQYIYVNPDGTFTLSQQR